MSDSSFKCKCATVHTSCFCSTWARQKHDKSTMSESKFWIRNLLRCYTITVLTKMLLYLLLRCYAVAGDDIIFFVICYYVVTLLPAVLLFSSLSGAPNDNFRKNTCLEDDLRSRIFEVFVVKFLACLPLLGFSNIHKMVYLPIFNGFLP